MVLRETAMPSVLVEAGYLTNEKEEAYLASEEGREAVAEAIFKAFKAYKRQMEDKVVTTPAKKTAPAKKTTTPAKKTDAVATVDKTKEPTAKPAKQTEIIAQKAEKPAGTAPKAVPAAQKQPVNAAPPKNTTTNTSGYLIHVLTWPTPMDKNTGKLALLTNVKEEKNGNEYHYLTGPYKTKEDADLMLTEIKMMGFRTAKLVKSDE